jgi:AMMECR1 domain-containing protein
VDGVVLQDGVRKATFLPQVWDQLPNPEQFLSQLCLKMGSPADAWRKKPLEVFTYQVQEFHE